MLNSRHPCEPYKFQFERKGGRGDPLIKRCLHTGDGYYLMCTNVNSHILGNGYAAKATQIYHLLSVPLENTFFCNYFASFHLIPHAFKYEFGDKMVPYQVYHMYSASVEKKLLYDGSEAVEKK